MSLKTIGTLTAAEMLAEIDAATVGLPEASDEWKTREEWEVVWGKAQATTSQLIRRACRAGLMEHKLQRRQTLRGLYPTPVYRWISETPKKKKSAKRNSRGEVDGHSPEGA